jgi:hypothetical protein
MRLDYPSLVAPRREGGLGLPEVASQAAALLAGALLRAFDARSFGPHVQLMYFHLAQARPDASFDAAWLPAMRLRRNARTVDARWPPFYAGALRACADLGITVALPDSVLALRRLPLWHNPRLQSAAVWHSWAEAGITRLGAVLTPDSRTIDTARPARWAAQLGSRGRFGGAALARRMHVEPLWASLPATADPEQWFTMKDDATVAVAVRQAGAGGPVGRRFRRAPGSLLLLAQAGDPVPVPPADQLRPVTVVSYPPGADAGVRLLWSSEDGPPPLAGFTIADEGLATETRFLSRVLSRRRAARLTARRPASIQRNRSYWEARFGAVDWPRQRKVAQTMPRRQHEDLLDRITNRMIVTAARASHWSGASPSCPLCRDDVESLTHMFAECRCVQPAWGWAAHALGAPGEAFPAAERTLSVGRPSLPRARHAVVFACRRAIWLERCYLYHHPSGRPNAFRLVARCASELRMDIALEFGIMKQRAGVLADAAAPSRLASFWARWGPLRRFMRVSDGGTRLAFVDLDGTPVMRAV